jgi:hypothetical protein
LVSNIYASMIQKVRMLDASWNWVIEYFSLIIACKEHETLWIFKIFWFWMFNFFFLGVLKKSKESILAKLKNATLFEVASSICRVMVPLFFTLLPFRLQVAPVWLVLNYDLAASEHSLKTR